MRPAIAADEKAVELTFLGGEGHRLPHGAARRFRRLFTLLRRRPSEYAIVSGAVFQSGEIELQLSPGIGQVRSVSKTCLDRIVSILAEGSMISEGAVRASKTVKRGVIFLMGEQNKWCRSIGDVGVMGDE